MFKPNTRCTRLLASSEARCAYVYRDGVVVVQERKIAVRGGEWATINIANVFPCKIHFGWTGLPSPDGDLSAIDEEWYKKSNLHKLGPSRIVVHEPDFIAYGIVGIHVYYNNWHHEKFPQNKGNMLVLETPDGVIMQSPNLYHLSGVTCVQPDPFNEFPYWSLYEDNSWEKSWKASDEHVIVVHESMNGVSGKI